MHDPFPSVIDPIDTMKHDTVPVIIDNGIDSSGVKCDSNTVYFELDVLPILRQNCAISGCHGAGTYEEGVNLENYQNTIATSEVKAFNLSKSELYKVITTTKQSDVMPPPPMSRLTSAQINTISEWILQGAKNEICNPNFGMPKACASEGTTYSGFVSKFMANNCVACHKGNSPSGGIRLDSHANVASYVTNGKLLGSLEWKTGYVKMPANGIKTDTCSINKIKFWINNGAKND